MTKAEYHQCRMKLCRTGIKWNSIKCNSVCLLRFNSLILKVYSGRTIISQHYQLLDCSRFINSTLTFCWSVSTSEQVGDRDYNSGEFFQNFFFSEFSRILYLGFLIYWISKVLELLNLFNTVKQSFWQGFVQMFSVHIHL